MFQHKNLEAEHQKISDWITKEGLTVDEVRRRIQNANEQALTDAFAIYFTHYLKLEEAFGAGGKQNEQMAVGLSTNPSEVSSKKPLIRGKKKREEDDKRAIEESESVPIKKVKKTTNPKNNPLLNLARWKEWLNRGATLDSIEKHLTSSHDAAKKDVRNFRILFSKDLSDHENNLLKKTVYRKSREEVMEKDVFNDCGCVDKSKV